LQEFEAIQAFQLSALSGRASRAGRRLLFGKSERAVELFVGLSALFGTTLTVGSEFCCIKRQKSQKPENGTK